MAETFYMDYSIFDELKEKMDEFGTGSGKVIAGVLQTQGAEIIKRDIQKLLPKGKRTWKKHRQHAKDAQPFTATDASGSIIRGGKTVNDQATIWIYARGKWGYLYFPDDGSNTLRHAGNQHFMQRGAEDSRQEIINRCIGKLIDNFNS